MPPRSKRNATSRRHHPSSQIQSSPLDTPLPPDLLTFGHETPPQTTYRSVTPAVFELEPPPSDPELGRASTAIWDGRDQDDLRAESVDYSHVMYGPGTSESDIDDGGPASPSTSPPGPSSLGNNFVMEDEPTAGLSALSKLANAAEDTTSDDSSLSRSVGHIRSPVLARGHVEVVALFWTCVVLHDSGPDSFVSSTGAVSLVATTLGLTIIKSCLLVHSPVSVEARLGLSLKISSYYS
ncbi:hypothetical protein BD311DRAFT_126923 [Dichomitus squalens]|uniref:Uncharacterized protein n=1 Tax=Dichomitus squalens TaxID=114155 RepID=A0A4Q9M6T9_9APHY|nr:hypothetical protein BD311DRAFT_126923 [Dichomitus squalens]